jgi:hypothetical protein
MSYVNKRGILFFPLLSISLIAAIIGLCLEGTR